VARSSVLFWAHQASGPEVEVPYAPLFVTPSSLKLLSAEFGVLQARAMYYIFVMSLLELEPIHTQIAQKPVLRAEVGMRVRCANKASAE